LVDCFDCSCRNHNLDAPAAARLALGARKSSPAVEIDFNSFDSAGVLPEPTLNLKELQPPQFGPRVAFL
jgi:hypothetical protein